MTRPADKAFIHTLDPAYRVQVKDIVKIEARVT